VQSLGNGTAFSTLAPSQQPGRRRAIQNIGERYSDYSPGPETWTLNILPLGQFRPHCGFLLAPTSLPSSVARPPHTAQ